MKIQREKLEQFKIDWEKIEYAQEMIYGLDDCSIIGSSNDHYEMDDRLSFIKTHIDALLDEFIKNLYDYYGKDTIIQAALDKLEEYAE